MFDLDEVRQRFTEPVLRFVIRIVKLLAPMSAQEMIAELPRLVLECNREIR